MLSVDGRCKTFDAAANGYVRAEGVGALNLSLGGGEDDCGDGNGNSGLFTLAASAVRQDGRSASLTAPSVAAQRLLHQTAVMRAHMSWSTWRGVEAHGTGTPLGDTTEIAGLAAGLTTLSGDSSAPHTVGTCLLYTSPSPRDRTRSRMPSSA